MAQELTISGALSFSKGSVAASLTKSGIKIDISGSTFVEGAATVTTSVTAIPLGSVATPGYMLAQNLDATNYVQIYDSTSGNPCVRLKPGEIALFRVDGSAPAWKAHTASCTVLYLLISD